MNQARLADNPIAIVGIAGLFPMARNFRDFWQNIVAAADCTAEVPATRWNIDDYYDEDPAAPDKTYCRRGGFVPEVPFSTTEFGLPPNQLDVTTVVQLLSLLVARDVLADAGAVDAGWYRPDRTGVVLGVAGPTTLSHPLAARLSTPVLKEVVRSCGLTQRDAELIAEKYAAAFAPWEENSFPGLLGNVIAGRVANRLDLGGMNCTIDAACASSLSAVHVAIGELVSGRADMMITGGCDTENSIFGYMCFSKTQALSRSGVIKPLDDSADGTLVGEGIGMLALKRLADAERDGDRVYAVIRGMGSSSDGRFKSIYAPRAEGQQAALRRAYHDADCSPATIELFEAHATGTRVGDQTELTALTSIVHEATDETGYAAIGSVKSQVGHTKGAAGAASLIKLALALHHKVLPPTINVSKPNKALDTADSPFYVNTRTRPWILDPRRPVRRAAASAMGFGGTNFHAVLQEAGSDRAPLGTLHGTARTYRWHAADPAALLNLVRSDAAPSDTPIPAEHARVGFVARDAQDARALRELAIAELASTGDRDEWSHPKGIFFRRRALPVVKIGALFAGQGSQYVDMGLAAVLNNPTLGTAFDEANAVFVDSARPMATVVFPPPVFDPNAREKQEAMLRRTDYAQPAIAALSVGQFRFLAERGLECAGFLGHSFGELTALWAAGALADRDLFALARARGEAMALPEGDRDPGTMAAVQAGREQVGELLGAHQGVAICNHNAPDQIVVGGGTDAVAKLVADCRERGINVRELPVAAAFHTEYVAHGIEPFRAAVGRTTIGEPRGRIYANSADAEYGASLETNRQILAEQLLKPVEFVRGLEAMRADGCTVFVEFGPKSVLTQLVRRTLGDDVIAIPTDQGPTGDGDIALKRAALRLAVLGAPITGVHRHDAPELVQPEPQGMVVPLTGRDFVSESRRQAYQRGIGEHTVLEAVTNATGLARDAAIAVSPAIPAQPGLVPTGPGFDVVAEQHLAVHNRYVEGQLQVAEGLVAVLRDAQRTGAVDDRLHATVQAVKEQSLAIGRTHTRVNEILASLTDAELGGTPAPTTTIPDDVALFEAPVLPSGNGHAPALPTGPAAAPVEAPQPAEPVVPGAGPDAIRSTLVAVVSEKTGYPVEMLDLSMDLEADLGVDSIKRVQIMGALRDRVDGLPAVGPEQVAELRTLNDIVGFVTGPTDSPSTGGGMDGAAVRSTLVALVSEKTGYPVEMLDLSMDLEADLGVDSIKRVQIMGALRDRVDGLPAVGPEQVAELRTLNDIVGFVAGPTGAAPVEREPVTMDVPVRRSLGLVRLPAVDRLDAPYADDRTALIVGNGDPTADVLADTLEQHGWTVRRGEPGQLDVTGRLDLCVTVLPGDGTWDTNTRRLADTILTARDVHNGLIDTAGRGTRAAFVTVTRIDGALGHRGDRPAAASLVGGVGGLVKTLAQEAPSLFCRALDVSPELADDALSEAFLTELADTAVDSVEVAVDNDGTRWTVRPVAPHDPTAADTALTVERDELIVVTGGGRGVTARCVRELATLRPCEFLLLGRTELTDEPAWAAGIADGALKPAVIEALRGADEPFTPKRVDAITRELLAQREIRATLDAITDAGGRARYVSVDLTDPAATAAALEGDRDRVTGLVHGAGVLADALLPAKTADDVRAVLGTKLDGLHNVVTALGDAPLRHVILFGSVAGVFGNPGQADYATANEALNRIALSWKRERPAAQVTAINWGAWDGGMVTPELREVFLSRGVALLGMDAGARMFAEQFTSARAEDVSVLIGPSAPLARPAGRATAAFAAHRDLARLAGDPVILDHRVGRFPVFPAAVGLGWMINVLERANPGLRVVECTGFEVLKGIVYDDTDHPDYRLDAEAAEPAGDRLTIRAWARSTTQGRPLPVSHFAGTFVLAAQPGPADTTTGYPVGDGPEDGLAIYQAADLFHGPLLQGIRRVIRREERRLVVECRLPDTRIGAGEFAGALHSPVLSDVVIQAGAVLGVWFMKSGCLPLAVGRIEYVAPLPDDAPFVVVVDDLRALDQTQVTVTATACDPDGRVLQRYTDLSVIATAEMTAKFAEAVRLREQGA